MKQLQFTDSQNTNDAGFTLLEIIVVLSIVAIVASISLSALRQRPDTLNLNKTVMEIASLLRSVRSNAVSRNIESTFSIDIEARSFWSGQIGKTRRIPNNVSIKIITAKTQKLSQSIARIRFFPDGSSTGGNIVLQRKKHSFEIKTDWLTGATVVHAIQGK